MMFQLPDHYPRTPVPKEVERLKLLLTRHDAAFALSLSVRSIDYLIASGKVTTRRIGSRVLVTADSVRRFAASNHYESVAVPSQTGEARR